MSEDLLHVQTMLLESGVDLTGRNNYCLYEIAEGKIRREQVGTDLFEHG